MTARPMDQQIHQIVGQWLSSLRSARVVSSLADTALAVYYSVRAVCDNAFGLFVTVQNGSFVGERILNRDYVYGSAFGLITVSMCVMAIRGGCPVFAHAWLNHATCLSRISFSEYNEYG